MIADHDKHLKAIERGEQKLQRHTDIMRAIAEKMPEEMKKEAMAR